MHLELEGAVEPGNGLDQLVLPGRILPTLVVVAQTAPIAQKITIPVLPAADATTASLDPANAGFHLLLVRGDDYRAYLTKCFHIELAESSLSTLILWF